MMKIFKNKTVKNAGWVIGEKMIQMLISLIVGLLTARYLGPSNYGLINYATSFTAFFAAFCNLGINSLLVKELVDRPEKEGEVLGTAIFLRGISSLLSAITIIAVVSIIDADESTRTETHEFYVQYKNFNATNPSITEYGFKEGKHEYFPFPNLETSINPNIVQNPGWAGQ